MSDDLVIDRIVHEVIQRMASLRPADPTPGPTPSCGTIGVKARVVSLAELDAHLARHRGESRPAPSGGQPINHPRALAKRLRDVTQILVQPGAVVTPAVRDLLRECNVPVLVSPQSGQTAGHSAVAVGVVAVPYDATALLRGLAREFHVQQVARTDLVTVVNELVDLVSKGGCLGLLICRQSILAVCLANRHRAVRAAAAADMDAAREAMEAVGVNLLVVNPARLAQADLIRMATVYCRQGPRICPEELRIPSQ